MEGQQKQQQQQEKKKGSDIVFPKRRSKPGNIHSKPRSGGGKRSKSPAAGASFYATGGSARDE